MKAVFITITCLIVGSLYGDVAKTCPPLSENEKKEYFEVIGILHSLHERHIGRIRIIYELPEDEELILLGYSVSRYTKPESPDLGPDQITYTYALKSSYMEVNDTILGSVINTEVKVMKFTKKYEVKVLLNDDTITFKELNIDPDGSSYLIEEFRPHETPQTQSEPVE
tara:strand:+ start:56 stop:559 length:504 start_codon:yes stop_codon:yes gene_type:complete